MQENHLFEYAVIRVVPRVEREEFLNVGVILYCPRPKFLQVMFTLDKQRLSAFSPSLDLAELEEHLRAFRQIALGEAEGGPIGRLDIASRFRWLTASRSTIVQTSKVHPGFCDDPAKALHRLHSSLVLPNTGAQN
ncbi:MAG TPA: DUF3037 domain-containing protein [Puia sp.]|jgi:hypothetical protein